MIKTRYEPYPKYKPSNVEWIGEIPEAWETKRIDWVMQYSKKTMRIESLKGKEVFHYSIPIIQETGDGQIEIADEISSDKITIEGGELLVSKLNPRKGMVLIALSKEIPIVCSSEFIPLIPKKIDLRFSFYLYSSSIIREKISYVVQSATFSHQRAKPRDISKQWFELPPLPEQCAIADFLDSETVRINGIVSKQTSLIELLKEKRSALITQVVTKGLDTKAKMKASGVDWIGKIPEGWEVRRLRRVCSRITDGAHISPDLSSEIFPFISTIDITNGQIDFINCIFTSKECYEYLVRTGCKPFVGDVLFSKDGTVGKTAITYCNIDFVVASSLVIISPKSNLDSRYLDYWLNNNLLQQEVSLQMSGSALLRISIENVGRLPILFPPLPEQCAIADFLDHEVAKIDTLIGKIEKQIELLNEYKQSLITHAVTGKIDVRDEINA